MNKAAGNVAEDESVVVLTGLVAGTVGQERLVGLKLYFPTLAVPVEKPRKKR